MFYCTLLSFLERALALHSTMSFQFSVDYCSFWHFGTLFVSPSKHLSTLWSLKKIRWLYKFGEFLETVGGLRNIRRLYKFGGILGTLGSSETLRWLYNLLGLLGWPIHKLRTFWAFGGFRRLHSLSWCRIHWCCLLASWYCQLGPWSLHIHQTIQVHICISKSKWPTSNVEWMLTPTLQGLVTFRHLLNMKVDIRCRLIQLLNKPL